MTRILAIGSLALALLAPLTACDRARTVAAADLDAAASDAAALSARAEPALVGLPVRDHLDAVVAPASLSGGPRPVVVVTHGAWDAPEPHCAIWQKTVRGRAFVLCPRGRATNAANTSAPPAERAYYYGDHLELGREVAAALDALRARYGDAVDVTRPVYAGFSQGAIQGAVMLRANASGFARAVLVEGGNGELDEWGPEAAKTFHAAGGERVLFGCGRDHCRSTAEVSSRFFRAAGVATRIVTVEGAGHTYGGPMEDAIRDAFAWVVEGDARFD